MGEDNRKDIYEEINYSYLALISKKLRVGVIGGGKAGAIKTKHFVKNKCYVEVLSKAFDKEIIELSNSEQERLILINNEFNYEFLRDKHVIVIAVDDESLSNKIKKYCDENYKLYVNSSNFKNGIGVIPIEGRTKNIAFALNTKGGNPKGAVLLSEKVKDFLEEYDEFIEFTGKIRNKAKELPEGKHSIIEFINNENFKKSFEQGNAENLLRENFAKEIVDYLLDF